MQFLPGDIIAGWSARHIRKLPFSPAPGRQLRFGPGGDALSDAIKPAGDSGFSLDRGRSPGEDQKRGLKGILGRMSIARESGAKGQHHGAVPVHEHREGRVILESQKAVEQYAVAQVPRLLSRVNATHVPQHVAKCSARHEPCPPEGDLPYIVQAADYSHQQ